MIHYILQIISFQLLFLAVYEFFLKKETFFTWNRVYLLLTPVLSFVLPLLKISVLQQRIPERYKISLPEILLGGTEQDLVVDGGTLPEIVVLSNSAVDLVAILLNIWYVGMAINLGVFCYKIYKIWRLEQAGIKGRIDGLRMITIPDSTVAFSFFNMMFLGADLSQKQRGSIVLHEAIHIKEKHSLDLLFFEIQRIVFWFNPLVYAYQKNMMVLQEYTADARVVAQQDKQSYYQNLLEQVFQTDNISFINTFFNHSLIKKRIIMLQKSKSNQYARLKYVLLIPVVCSMLFYVACSEDTRESSSEITAKKEVEGKNLVILLMQFGNTEALSIGVKDLSLLSEDELSFVQLAQKEDGFKDLKNGSSDSFNEAEELFFVNYTNRLKGVIKSKNIEFQEIYSNKKDNSTEDFGERESKQIDLDDTVPFSVIEKVPTYPGCAGDNNTLKECMSEKISTHVNRNFNTDLGAELGLIGMNRIFVSFKIDKRGNVVNIRSRAPHPDLEIEAERVIKTLPKMQPGEQKGEAVAVLYSLPITFKIEE